MTGSDPVRPIRVTGPRIGARHAGPTTIRGTVVAGVEPGCIVLVDDAGVAIANLQGWDLRRHPFDSRVEVTGTFQPDLMTTCQQGIPFDVSAVVTG